jgi:uncharacterized small protein (DUF1192 family)
MSIADAVRARELEARVAALEQRIEEAPAQAGESSIPAFAGTYAELDQRVKMLQGQLNSLRAKVDRLTPPSLSPFAPATTTG